MDIPSFDELKALAQHDPESFEQLRAALIDDCIRRCSVGNQRRLRGRQFLIDSQRQIAGSPMKALLEIQAMMNDSLLAFHQVTRTQQSLTEPSVPTNAQILPFPRSKSSKD